LSYSDGCIHGIKRLENTKRKRIKADNIFQELSYNCAMTKGMLIYRLPPVGAYFQSVPCRKRQKPFFTKLSPCSQFKKNSIVKLL
jgi:hypothetical protein